MSLFWMVWIAIVIAIVIFAFGHLHGHRQGYNTGRQRGYLDGYGSGSQAAAAAQARQEQQRVNTIPAAIRRGESLIPPRPAASKLVSPPPADRRENRGYSNPVAEVGLDDVIEPVSDDPSPLGVALGAMTLQALSEPVRAPEPEPYREPYREPDRCESPRYEAPSTPAYDSGSCGASSSGGGCSDGGGGCGGGGD